MRVAGPEFTECFNERFQTLVRSPFSKSQNALPGIRSSGEIREFGMLRQDSVGPEMNVTATVFFQEDVAIGRHQHGHRIGQQQHFG